MKVKDYNKKILFFLMCIFIALWFACTNNKSGSSLSSGTNSETGYIKFNVSSSVLQSKLNIVRSVLRSTVSKTDAAKLIVSIEDDSGNNTYVDKELTLYAMGDDFISAPLSLEVGKNYSLTKFLVADKDNNIIFATPLKDSAQAKLVTNPLPIALNNITKDTVAKTTPEVTAIDNFNAKDFGYASFDFDIIETFQFKVAAMIYDTTLKNWKLTDAQFEVTDINKKTLNSGNIQAVTTSIGVPSKGHTQYTLKITKTGYKAYSKNFSQDELKNLFNNPLKALLIYNNYPNYGLAIYYPFNGNANDSSGNNHDGIVYGAKLTTDRFENENSAYYFDGDNDYIETKFIPDNIFSIALFYNTSTSQKNHGSLFSTYKYNNGFKGIYYPIGTSGSQEMIYIDENNAKGGIDGNPTKWVHLAIVSDGNNVKIYKNGKLVTSISGSTTHLNSLLLARSIYWTAATWDTNRYFAGKIDDVFVYNRVLTENEIKTLYNNESVE